MNCQIHLVQLDPTLGNLEANLEMHLVEARSAAEKGADCVLFSELSLTGYFLKDQTAEVAMKLDDERLAELAVLKSDEALERRRNRGRGEGT